MDVSRIDPDLLVYMESLSVDTGELSINIDDSPSASAHGKGNKMLIYVRHLCDFISAFSRYGRLPILRPAKDSE